MLKSYFFKYPPQRNKRVQVSDSPGWKGDRSRVSTQFTDFPVAFEIQTNGSALCISL